MAETMRIISTTVLAVRRGSSVALAGDGQVTLNNTIVKVGAKKVRRLAEGRVLGAFALPECLHDRPLVDRQNAGKRPGEVLE